MSTAASEDAMEIDAECTSSQPRLEINQGLALTVYRRDAPSTNYFVRPLVFMSVCMYVCPIWQLACWAPITPRSLGLPVNTHLGAEKDANGLASGASSEDVQQPEAAASSASMGDLSAAADQGAATTPGLGVEGLIYPF